MCVRVVNLSVWANLKCVRLLCHFKPFMLLDALLLYYSVFGESLGKSQ